MNTLLKQYYQKIIADKYGYEIVDFSDGNVSELLNNEIEFIKLGDTRHLAMVSIFITTKNPDKINQIAQQILEILHNIGIDVEILKTEIHNVVVHARISLKRSLESIIVNLDPKKASFEPEQFPALVYKDWGVSFLLFSSGSCIISGLKDFNDAERAIGLFKDLIGV